MLFLREAGLRRRVFLELDYTEAWQSTEQEIVNSGAGIH